MDSAEMPLQKLRAVYAATNAKGRAEVNVQALDRGLRVLTAMADHGKPCTVSDIAQTVNITRAAARRFILTLEHLGYVEPRGPAYVLKPRVLELGEVYLASQPLVSAARPHLEELAEAVGETVSLTMLSRGLVTYIDRVQASRILAINIVVGSRVPAYATATGRVLLSQLEDPELDAYLSSLEATLHAANSRADIACIRATVRQAQIQGWYLADQELRSGIRSLAAPVKTRDQQPPAAINISASASRVTENELKSNFLTRLRVVSNDVSQFADGVT